MYLFQYLINHFLNLINYLIIYLLLSLLYTFLLLNANTQRMIYRDREERKRENFFQCFPLLPLEI